MEEQSVASESYRVPPGFRFHPTEEELVAYYLARKVVQPVDLVDGIIQEVDLYSIEPWDLQARCGGTTWQQQQAAEQDCYFFSYKDRKYPSGTRTNRATAAGFWKATGRDKPVLSSRSSAVIGMRKTLVFYRGRAPNGSKTDWIIHEYRLVADQQEQEGWVVCRAFQKPTTLHQLHLQRPPSSCSFFPATTYAPPLLHLQQQQQPGYYDDDLLAASRALPPHPPAPVAGGLPYSSLDLDLEDEEESKMILSGIPRLVSPTAVQTTAAGGNNVTAPAAADRRRRRHPELLAVMQQQAGAGPIDWNFLDALLHDSAAATSLLY